MTNRVLLNSSGLKVSKPGVNVLTASASQLDFNSDWAQVGIYGRGTYTVDWPFTSTTINIGKTYPTAPIVIFEISYGGAFYTIGGPGGFFFEVYEDGLGSGGTGYRYHWLLGRVTTTQILINGEWNKYASSDPEPPHYVIRYSICDYNL